MENTKKNTKRAIIIIASVLAAALIIVPMILIFATRSVSPIKFLMEKDLSEYVVVGQTDSIDYAQARVKLKSGYDTFRVSLTEAYFGTSVYVEEGSTIDMKLAADLVEESDGKTKYTKIELPEKYSSIQGYRPYSAEENRFFDIAMAGAGTTDEYKQHYMTRGTETQFTAVIPEGEAYGEYAGKTVRFTITVTDYVSRYVYLYDGADQSISTVSDWYSKIVGNITPQSNEKIEKGDVIIYDCTDKNGDGTISEYKDLYLEVTEGDIFDIFGGYAAGDKFTKTVGSVTEDFTVKAVFKLDDAKKAINDMGYESVFVLKEELRMWCYAVYSDGFTLLASESSQVISYPKSLISVYKKLEYETWETEFRESAMSFAKNFGDDTALTSYGITGYDTMEEYLDDLLNSHVETLVGELLVTYEVAREFGILDDLYERYTSSLENYIEAGKFASKDEALASLADNADEACIFYSNFISPILGKEYALKVNGAPFAQYIADSYAS